MGGEKKEGGKAGRGILEKALLDRASRPSE